MNLFKTTYLKRDFSKWSLYTLIIIAFIAIPLFTIFFEVFYGPGESWDHVKSYLLLDYTMNSLYLIVGCILLTFIFGVSSAWIISRYELPFQNWLEWLLILPLAIPSYITAYAYSGFFDYNGGLERVLGVFGVSFVKFSITNIFGLIFILSVSLFPYVYVVSRAVFLYQSGRLIEASKVLGASESKTFFKIVLPIARPAIVGGLVLVLMEVLNDFGAAKYYGVNTFTTGIFRSWFALEEISTAVYLSAILLLVVFSIIGLERFLRGDRNYEIATKSDFKLPKLKLTFSKRLLFVLIVSIPILFGFVLPLLQLMFWCVLTFSKVASLSFVMIALQSLGIAVLTSIVTVVFALMLLYIPKWNRISMLSRSSYLAILGYAIPGAVLAIGVMIPTLHLDKWLIKVVKSYLHVNIGLVINGTIIVLVYAYIIRFIAVAFNPLEAGQLKIGKSFTESSKLLGQSNIKTFFKIDLPLLKPSLLSAFILVFVDTMKELPLTLLLKPYDINTLAVKAYEYASDELIMESALPSLCIIATGVLPIILLNKLILKGN